MNFPHRRHAGQDRLFGPFSDATGRDRRPHAPRRVHARTYIFSRGTRPRSTVVEGRIRCRSLQRRAELPRARVTGSFSARSRHSTAASEPLAPTRDIARQCIACRAVLLDLSKATPSSPARHPFPVRPARETDSAGGHALPRIEFRLARLIRSALSRRPAAAKGPKASRSFAFLRASLPAESAPPAQVTSP